MRRIPTHAAIGEMSAEQLSAFFVDPARQAQRGQEERLKAVYEAASRLLAYLDGDEDLNNEAPPVRALRAAMEQL